jgi:hypothetical protein
MPAPIPVNLPSTAARRLVMRSLTGASIGTATGVLVRAGDLVWMVSNWHVLAGRSVYTGEPRHSSAAVPASMTWHVSNDPICTPLSDEHGGDLWTEHPQGRDVDLAARFLGLDPGLAQFALPLVSDLKLRRLEVTQAVSIVGYPDGLTGGQHLPIWTRGNVATENDIEIGGKPRILVDALTRQGQSGSPVVVFGREMEHVIDRRQPDRGEFAVAHYMENQTVPVGIYSGRINADISLGYVWKWSAVVELIEHAAGSLSADQIALECGPTSTPPVT